MITHNPTGRAYIGSSATVESRIQTHLSNLRGGRHPVEDMQADFDAYGGNYSVVILESVEGKNTEDRFREYEWMRLYRTNERGRGYNYKDRVVSPYQHSPKKERYLKEIDERLRRTDDLVLLDLVLKILEKSDT